MQIKTHGQTLELLNGDSLRLMGEMTGKPFGAVITDPPYASDGATLASKQQGFMHSMRIIITEQFTTHFQKSVLKCSEQRRTLEHFGTKCVVLCSVPKAM